MTEEKYLARLIAEGEHVHQDFKYRVSDAVKLSRSVSAFANTDGGRLLIGVRDDGFVAGVRKDEEIFMMREAAERYCRPRGEVSFSTIHMEGRGVVVCEVSKSAHRPVRALAEDGRYKAYVRVADENIVASPVHLRLWKDEDAGCDSVMAFTTTEQTFMEQLAARPGITLGRLQRIGRLSRASTVSLLARLIRYRVVTMSYADRQWLFAMR